MSEWNPNMDEAPKDETPCLFYAPGNPKATMRRARTDAIRVDRRRVKYGRKYAGMMPEAPYTHWRHLPPPPEDV